MKKKTTYKDLLLFRRKFLEYCVLWGINDWEYAFSRTDLETSYATTAYSLRSRKVHVSLTANWDDIQGSFPMTVENLTHTAKHEAIHALLGPLSALNDSRWCTEDEAIGAEHAIVMRLLNLLP